MIQKAFLILALISVVLSYRVMQTTRHRSADKDESLGHVRSWSHWQYGPIQPSTDAFVAGYNSEGAPLYSAMTIRGNHTVLGSYEAKSKGASVVTDDEPALALPYKILLGDFRTYPSEDGAYAAKQAGFDEKGHPQFLCVGKIESGKYPGSYTTKRGKCRFAVQGEKKVRESDDFQFVG